MPLVHQPPIVAWPQADPLPGPWVSCESNAIGFPTHFVGPSRLLLSSPRLPGSFVDVDGNSLVVVDPRLRHTKSSQYLNIILKYFFPNYTKIQKNEICKNFLTYLCHRRRTLVEVACLDLP
jgi:hypothetical protein